MWRNGKFLNFNKPYLLKDARVRKHFQNFSCYQDRIIKVWNEKIKLKLTFFLSLQVYLFPIVFLIYPESVLQVLVFSHCSLSYFFHSIEILQNFFGKQIDSMTCFIEIIHLLYNSSSLNIFDEIRNIKSLSCNTFNISLKLKLCSCLD